MLEKLGEQIKLIIQLSTKNMHDFKQSVKSKIELLWLSFVAKLQVLLAVVKLQLVMVKVRVARSLCCHQGADSGSDGAHGSLRS